MPSMKYNYIFENPKIKFKMNKNLSFNSKNVVYIIECDNCKEAYIISAQTFNTRISLRKINTELPENRKLNVSKHLYQSSKDVFKTILIYQTNDYTLLQIKEKLHRKFKPTLYRNHTHTHTHTHTNTHAQEKS